MIYNRYTEIPRILSIGRMAWEASAHTVKARNFSALSYRLRGEGRIQAGDTAINITQGSVLFIPAGTDYTCDYTDTAIICFHFYSNAVLTEAPQVYDLPDPISIEFLFQSALKCWENKQPGYELQGIGIYYQILAMLNQYDVNRANLSEKLRRATELLKTGFKDPELKIADVCMRCGISESALRKFFSRHFEKSPVQYLTQLRLEYARTLMLSRHISIETAAYASGFSDAKYFARVVKKTYGCTPSQLKNLYL